MRRFHNTLTPLVTAALVILIGFAPPAHAVAPKGAVLSITVTTNSDQGEQTYDSKSDQPSGVTVLLSPAAPTLSSQLVSYESSDGTIEIRYSYTITTNANGADDYKLDVQPGASTNMVGEAEGIIAVPDQGSGDPITLSATAALVPHSAGDTGVYVSIPLTTEGLPDENQIQVGDTVVIGGAVYKVADHGAVNAADAESFPQLNSWTSHKLIFETPLISDVSVGDLIAEQKTFDMWVWNPKIDDDTLPATVGMIVTATSASDSAFSVQDETLTSLYPAAGPSIEVFVRNVTVPTTGIDPAYTSISGDDFFSSIPVYADPSTSPWKVSVSPGDTLQYAIVQKAGNDSAKAPLTNVVLKAGMPPFSTYVPGSTTVNAASLDDVGDPAQSQVFYGVMVQSPGSAAGNIATNDRAEVIFMVKMDESSGGNGALSNASIQWETDPDRVTFTWTVTGLSSEYEYWVYPHVGFTENGGPFGSTPEDEANDLKGMYSMATPGYRPAEDGAGSWNYYGGKPTNPSGRLALLAYDASSGNAWVVDISEEINIDAW